MIWTLKFWGYRYPEISMNQNFVLEKYVRLKFYDKHTSQTKITGYEGWNLIFENQIFLRFLCLKKVPVNISGHRYNSSNNIN